MIRRSKAQEPCELAREALFSKTYRAALMGDGSVLPIEERLGRRLLRTIAPESQEGRQLLLGGKVILRRENEEWTTPIHEALDRLEHEVRDHLEEGDLETRRQLTDTLHTLAERRRAYRF